MKPDKVRVYAPIKQNNENSKLNEDGTLTITGIAATTSKDFNKEILTAEAVQGLAKQVKGLNLHLDHDRHYDGAIGAIPEAYVEDNKLHITAKVVPEFASELAQRLGMGMNYGFSISGFPVMNSKAQGLIDRYNLVEISLTPVPANWDTFGTVKIKNAKHFNCFNMACKSFIEDNNMTNNNNQTIEEEPTEGLNLNDVVKLINEAWAEKEEAIVETVKREIQNIIPPQAAQEGNESTPNNPEPKEGEGEEGEGEGEDENNNPPAEPKPNEGEEGEEGKEGEDKKKKEEEINTKSIEAMFKELKQEIASTKANPSKFQEYMNTKNINENKTFLNSEKRDQYGRNKRYLH